MWSKTGIKTIRSIKRRILKKKILLNFIIDNYSWWDKFYRWVHITIAAAAPVVSVLNNIDNAVWSSSLSILLSCVVAGMVKMNDYINFSEMKDLAKSQTVKYSQLYEQIENELIKPHGEQQIEHNFIYWINRELLHIEILNPELSAREKMKFIKKCKLNHISYDDDIGALKNMIDEDKEKYTGEGGAPIPHHVISLGGGPKHARDSYKQTLKNLKPAADLAWAINRLQNLDIY